MLKKKKRENKELKLWLVVNQHQANKWTQFTYK